MDPLDHSNQKSDKVLLFIYKYFLTKNQEFKNVLLSLHIIHLLPTLIPLFFVYFSFLTCNILTVPKIILNIILEFFQTIKQLIRWKRK